MSESYVGKPFKHDIFITYSHGDADGDGIAKLKQWSEGFARELEEELKAMPDLAANIRIFRDENDQLAGGLDPMAPLTEQLKEDVARSAILAILMTPQYLRSAWCKDEREWWLDQQDTADLAVDGRLAVARIWPTKDMDWPKELTDSRGHKLIGRCAFSRICANGFNQCNTRRCNPGTTGPVFIGHPRSGDGNCICHGTQIKNIKVIGRVIICNQVGFAIANC